MAKTDTTRRSAGPVISMSRSVQRPHAGCVACLLLLPQHRDVRRARRALRNRVQGATVFMSFGCDAMRLQENKEEQSMATEARETAGLIGSDKVEGTYVYDAKGENIGSIERVMIDKQSGQVAYAVLQFGGFLGIGSDYYPIPWQSLTYDTGLGGYHTNITE